MEKKLLKKSFQLKGLKEIPYDSLWNTKGAFTTIRILGRKPKFIFLNEHIKNLNESLNELNINFSINTKIFKNLFINNFVNKNYYNYLLRIAVNEKKISFDLRKKLTTKKFFKGILINYRRKNSHIKNLHYIKILNLLESINSSCEEVIICEKDKLLEGCTTNIVCVKNKTLYIPKKNYYFGITLKIIKKNTKRKVVKTNILKKNLKFFDEILLLGSGKGVVALNNIPQLNWKNKSQVIYNELQALYKLHSKK